MFRRVLSGVCLMAAGWLCTAAAQAIPGLHVVYSLGPAAGAIHSGAPGAPGLSDAVRQGPILDDPRWPPSRQLVKVAGRALAIQPAPEMAATLRSALASGGFVGVDELVAGQWDVPQATALHQALTQLGPEARRVVLYVGPALVSQIGRADPRVPLTPRLATLLEAMRLAGAVMLETYGLGGRPFTQAEMAIYPTRWLARWAPGDAGTLHLITGPGGTVGIETIWSWLQASPAGRTILANGPAAYGLQTAEEGVAWLANYRAFLAGPTAPPPAGDYPVPVGGGVTVTPPAPGARTFNLVLSRSATAIIRLVPLDGQARTRVIGRIVGPTPETGVTVSLPSYLPAGNYQLVTIVTGQELRDESVVPLTVGPVAPAPVVPSPAGPAAPAPVVRSVSLSWRAGRLSVSLAPGQRAIVQLVPARGPRRAIAQLRGSSRPIVVFLPRDVPPGTYRAIVTAIGSAGRQVAQVRIRVRAVRTVSIAWRGGRLAVTVARGQRATVQLVPARGPRRAIARLRGSGGTILVRLPDDVVPGAYRAIATATGSAGRQVAQVRFRVR